MKAFTKGKRKKTWREILTKKKKLNNSKTTTLTQVGGADDDGDVLRYDIDHSWSL